MKGFDYWTVGKLFVPFSSRKNKSLSVNQYDFFFRCKRSKENDTVFLFSTNILDITMLLDCKNLMNCFYVVSVERCDAVHWTQGHPTRK